MQCFVYRSRRRRDTYLYLPAKGEFSRLPTGLMK
ncbi:MAG TPA: YcgL domain-containing protein, partial [Gammaproteobacteria bacterium]|nr:YcgL domain-containing protein [Gammaproteobacteria bacterium]